MSIIHYPGIGPVDTSPRVKLGPGDLGWPDDGDKLQEAADDKYMDERTDLWALASQLDWLWYSPKEARHDPTAVEVLSLIANGADDAQLGKLIRERVHHELKKHCYQMAEDEANGVLS